MKKLILSSLLMLTIGSFSTTSYASYEQAPVNYQELNKGLEIGSTLESFKIEYPSLTLEEPGKGFLDSVQQDPTSAYRLLMLMKTGSLDMNGQKFYSYDFISEQLAYLTGKIIDSQTVTEDYRYIFQNQECVEAFAAIRENIKKISKHNPSLASVMRQAADIMESNKKFEDEEKKLEPETEYSHHEQIMHREAEMNQNAVTEPTNPTARVDYNRTYEVEWQGNTYTEIYIGEGRKEIQEGELSNIADAILIYIPDSITAVSEDIFEGCPVLQYVIAPSHLKEQIDRNYVRSFIEATYIWHNADGSYTDDAGNRYEMRHNVDGRITEIMR